MSKRKGVIIVKEFPVTLYGGILEIESPVREIDKPKAYRQVINSLQSSMVDNKRILYVIEDSVKDHCHVPHFGHDYSCDDKCKQISCGVDRYFGISLIIEGSGNSELFGDYQIDHRSRLYLCLFVNIKEIEPINLEKILDKD